MKKIIFLDIDGTLTEPGSNEPPKSALRAIEEARKNGHYVFLCTGRNYDMLRPLLRYDFDGVIASSGGYITCQDEVIYDCPMTSEQTQKALQVFKKNGVFCTVECLGGTFTDEGFRDFLRDHAREDGNSELLRWREQIEKSLNMKPMSEYAGEPVYKIVVMSPSEECLKEPMAVMQPEFSFCIQEMEQKVYVNGEMLGTQFDKGKAVERVCERLQIPVADTFAFGDSMNDKEMMETAGFSVCMDNGSKTLKAISDAVCPSVGEDGIWKSFVKYGLIAG